MTFTTGLTIAKYVLGKKLGQGGFGTVFVARDTALDRDVALKFLNPEHTASAEILRRFLQEARSAAKIVHPGIVTVFECGQVAGTGTSADGVAFMAMELLHGESLSDRLARAGRLPADHAMEIARQVASALEAAHAAGIIHRDLKPDNIFLVRDPLMPGGERVKVLDFGIAKLAPTANTSGVQTQSMMVFGTPRYMSPEQCRSSAHIDHRSDIYALGCILYELVAGRPPFTGETGELIAKHQLVAPASVTSIVGELPADLEELVTAMLAKDPADRPQTMAAVQRALEQRGVMAAGVAPTLLPDEAQRTTPQPSPSTRRSAPVAAATPTTLGGASGQWADAPAKPSKLPLVLGGVAIAGAAVVATILATRHGDAGARASAPPPPPTEMPVAPREAAPPAPAPAQIEWRIDATPGAAVWDGNKLLGETPYTDKRPPERGMLQLVIKADGYQDQAILMPLDKSEHRTVTLEVAATKIDKRRPAKPLAPKQDAPKRVLKPGELPDD